MEITRAEFKRLIIAVILVLIAFYVAILLIIRPYKKQAIKKTAAITKALIIKHCKKEILHKNSKGIVSYIQRCQIITKNESINRSGSSGKVN